VDDAHLLEGLDDRARHAEVGERLRDHGLGLGGRLDLLGRERLVRGRDVGAGLVPGLVVEEVVLERQVLALELGVQDAFGRVRVGLRVQRFACLRLRWPHEPARRERIAVPRLAARTPVGRLW
jgi:hypothetical protein